jgi:hypothetical protein
MRIANDLDLFDRTGVGYSRLAIFVEDYALG